MVQMSVGPGGSTVWGPLAQGLKHPAQSQTWLAAANHPI